MKMSADQAPVDFKGSTMNKLLLIGAGFGVVLAAGVAMAQAPGPAAPPPGEMGRGPMGEMGRGPMEHMGPGMHGMHRPPPSKAARFMFRKGDAVVAIKCADDEPTKACVDAGSALLDKLAAQQPK
jgi:hypothetical protein